MWDEQDRREDERRLARGEMVFDQGHAQTTSTTLDAELDELLEMPSESPWPLALAAAVSGVFVLLLTGHWTTAMAFAAAGLAVLAVWHAREAPLLAGARRTIANGVWGMLLFAATEAGLFGTLLGSYFYLRFSSPEWPPPGIDAPSVALPLALCGVLVLATAPVVIAALAARAGRVRAALPLLALAVLIGGGYLAWQIVLYVDDLGRFSPDATAYGSIYFTLLAAHHAHVALGLVLELWLLARLAAGVTHYRVVALQAIALYWVFVAAMAVLVVAAQVSPS
jgi:cytochrome c oxidase subunit III